MPNEQTAVPPFNEDRVLKLSEFAILAGISLITLRRLIARGEGPAVTPKATRDALWEKHKRKLAFPAGLPVSAGDDLLDTGGEHTNTP